ncbi:hypothetical protein BO70DRAFT_362888 [Aspergillus heteromorphus CBS 117.55]|uniref:Uncharacterized protein n=1 Tax=Aspergillus heteromorphus CBS 117.55 TaxID=1448321 RepID=A0A317W1Q4_9EURO|nr:uncharacterized protein BO70DRAFT_362888 [Aspergillus heteromorphus CBS 117.55]PWY79108.1 hypothetical protein BO70DRAFT_362888 [Aspergillus heteromorphus CBS 117.55]
MEFLSRNSGVKRRTSFSFLFGSQKLPFALNNGQPTRYYDFVDTPGIYKPSSPLIERQNIPTELEAEMRYACALLVYRIEQGRHLPSSPTKRSRGMTTSSAPQDPSTIAQIDSKFISPKVGRDVAALKDKHDSGVVLTQQSSMQTMRVKPCQSNPQTKSADKTASGPATTSDSSSSAHSCTAPPSRGSAQRQELAAEPDAAIKDQTKAFLDGSESQPSTDEDEDLSEDDVEVFLDPDAMVISGGVHSFSSPQANLNKSSPSLGVSVDPSNNQSTETGPADSVASLLEHRPGVIIDRSGLAHVMTAAEESERDINLRQAVLAKMRTGTIAHASSPHLPACDMAREHRAADLRPGSNASRLKTSWSTMALRRKPCGTEEASSSSPSSSSNGPTVFRKLVNFFSKRRPANVVPPVVQ